MDDAAAARAERFHRQLERLAERAMRLAELYADRAERDAEDPDAGTGACHAFARMAGVVSQAILLERRVDGLEPAPRAAPDQTDGPAAEARPEPPPHQALRVEMIRAWTLRAAELNPECGDIEEVKRRLEERLRRDDVLEAAACLDPGQDIGAKIDEVTRDVGVKPRFRIPEPGEEEERAAWREIRARQEADRIARHAARRAGPDPPDG